MRLLNTTTFQLEIHNDNNLKYAILSHTWGEDEILFEDVQHPSSWINKRGGSKVFHCCARAQADGYKYIWIDTCCIDKSSSAELSEALNSMFHWYAESEVCYAFLSDAKKGNPITGCRWFTRGWTLQELIAPKRIEFYDENWEYLGDRMSLINELVAIALIDRPVLARELPGTSTMRPHGISRSVSMPYYDSSLESLLESYTISRRMSWASNRSTQREEDGAYSLMGLFGVKMPLLYGEGSRAFRRLQEEIIKESNDQSILAYYQQHLTSNIGRLFPSAPSMFVPNIELQYKAEDSQIYFANGGLSVELRLCPCLIETVYRSKPSLLGILDCVLETDFLSRPGILLEQAYGNDSSRYWRISPSALYIIGLNSNGRASPITVGQANNNDITFNLEQAYTRRVTLVETSKGGDHTTLSAKTMPLRIKVIEQPAQRHFTIDVAYPNPSGSFILPRRSNSFNMRPDPALGMISLHENNSNRFVIIWGSDCDEETSLEKPWCKIWPLQEMIDDPDDGRSEDEVVHEIVEVFEQHKFKRMRSFSPHDAEKSGSYHIAIGENEGTHLDASISLVSFLGRHILDLQITVKELEPGHAKPD
ncbi:heterokaryon incompatibility protein-domain-containing protein [Xylaria flabelliformis]|nr:heterokaryon incompatibility protein-domain-containing protein [Xylaria flabelliformis]